MTEQQQEQFKQELTKQLTNSFLKGWTAGAKFIVNTCKSEIEKGISIEEIDKKLTALLTGSQMEEAKQELEENLKET